MRISNLLDCSCLGSMAMLRVWVFLGWFVGLFLLSLPFSFCLALCGLSCTHLVYSLFWSIYYSLSIKKKKNHLQCFVNKYLVSDSPKL